MRRGDAGQTLADVGRRLVKVTPRWKRVRFASLTAKSDRWPSGRYCLDAHMLFILHNPMEHLLRKLEATVVLSGPASRVGPGT